MSLSRNGIGLFRTSVGLRCFCLGNSKETEKKLDETSSNGVSEWNDLLGQSENNLKDDTHHVGANQTRN